MAPSMEAMRRRLAFNVDACFLGATIEDVPPDGSCQFHALVAQLRRVGVRADARALRLACVQ